MAHSYGAPADAHAPTDDIAAVDALADDYVCWCGFRDTSYRSLVMHATRRHGYRKGAYSYVTECGTCLACLRCFHMKFRLLSHLDRTSAACLAILAAPYSPVLHGSDKSKFGKVAKGDALYRHGPKRRADRLQVLQ